MSDDLRARAIDIRRGICSDPGVCVERNYLGCECVADIEAALRAAVEAERARCAERVGELAATALGIIRELENER